MDRTSFVLHLDSLEILDELNNEQKGELLQAIVDFQMGKDIDVSQITKIAFIPIKNQLIRDNNKYQATVARNKANGAKGGRPKANDNPNNPVGLSDNPSEPKKPENDSDSDNDKEEIKDNSQPEQSSSQRKNPSTPYKKILELYANHLNGNDDHNLVEVMELTPKRKSKMNTLWLKIGRDITKLDNYFRWIYEARDGHTWLFGENDRGWKADIEYVCRIETFAKAKEGRLGNWGQAA